MAGIGFVLRRLANRDDLLSVVMGYSFAFMISSGPWILTSLTLGGSMLFGSLFTSVEDQSTFRLIIIYNFSFSLVLCGPVLMVATRHLSDLIYRKQLDEAPGLLVGVLLLVLGLQCLLAAPFYARATLPQAVKLQAVFGYVLISGVWTVSIFLSAMKNYVAITRIFAMGMVLAMALAALLAPRYGVAGMLGGFNLGLSMIVFTMVARVFSEYPFPIRKPFAYVRGFRPYWALALSGLLHNLAAWVDKWIMWFSPQRDFPPSGLISYPDYDSAMFLAYLTIAPSLAVFLVSVETRFFEGFYKFFQNIQQHRSYDNIEQGRREMVQAILSSGRNLLILQGAITLMAVLMAPSLFRSMSINFLQLSIFRIGAVGAMFHVLAMFLMIVLSYFDLRKPVLWINLLFFGLNGALTLLGMGMGFQFYGYGYFLAALMTFAAAYLTLFHHLERLPYYVFVKNNPSVM